MIEPTTPPDLLDTSVLADIRALPDSGQTVLAELVKLFVADATLQLSALGAAIAAGNAQAIGQIAHRLRGASLTMGACRMVSTCEAVENAARGGGLDRVAADARRMASEFESTRLALEREIHG